MKELHLRISQLTLIPAAPINGCFPQTAENAVYDLDFNQI